MNKFEILAARRDKMREVMEEYDRDVYYPAMKKLQEECILAYGSHLKTTFHRNGLGWQWWYCGRCGAAHDKRNEDAII